MTLKNGSSGLFTSPSIEIDNQDEMLCKFSISQGEFLGMLEKILKKQVERPCKEEL